MDLNAERSVGLMTSMVILTKRGLGLIVRKGS